MASVSLSLSRLSGKRAMLSFSSTQEDSVGRRGEGLNGSLKQQLQKGAEKEGSQEATG